jgi:hypothetical protein
VLSRIRSLVFKIRKRDPSRSFMDSVRRINAWRGLLHSEERKRMDEGLKATVHSTTPSRFVLRKGAVEGKWMIWDRERRGPARLVRGLACELSEEQARKFLKHLTRADSCK